MLTEPLTSPSTLRKQRWYSGIAGILFPPQVHIAALYTTPELVLVVSNIFSYIVSPKVKLILSLQQNLLWGSSIKDFIFKPNQQFTYQAGQYMEFTLPHNKPDSRGSRRYFTLASSPTEDVLRLGIKFYPKGSSFKQALQTMHQKTPIAAAQLSGDFVLPKDKTRKLAFIAGGIGVTPFRSMLKYLTDTGDQRSVALLYGEKTIQDIAYHDVFEAARQRIGAHIVYAISDENATPSSNVRSSTITSAFIQTEIPDYIERLFYVSGPQPMVQAVKQMLLEIGVVHKNIKVDYFPGYA